MMQIFPYIFYTFSKMYRAGLDRRDPDIYASGFLSLFQAINIMTVIGAFISEKQFFILAWVLAFVLVLTNNIFFFNKKSLSKFDERWDGEPKGKRLVKRILILIYVILTFYLPIALYMKPID